MGCLVGPLRWFFYRFTPWGRWLALGEMVLGLRATYRRLTPEERSRLTQIVRRSRGLPGRVSHADRKELQRLVKKAGAGRFTRTALWAWRPLPGRRRREGTPAGGSAGPQPPPPAGGPTGQGPPPPAPPHRGG